MIPEPLLGSLPPAAGQHIIFELHIDNIGLSSHTQQDFPKEIQDKETHTSFSSVPLSIRPAYLH